MISKLELRAADHASSQVPCGCREAENKGQGVTRPEVNNCCAEAKMRVWPG